MTDDERKQWNADADALLIDIGRNIGKSEYLGRDLDRFNEMGNGTAKDQTRLRPQGHHEMRKMRRNIRPVICTQGQAAANTDDR